MRQRFALPKTLTTVVAALLVAGGLVTTPTSASAVPDKPAATPPPVGKLANPTEKSERRHDPLRWRGQPTTTAAEPAVRRNAVAQSCTPNDFGSRTGSALVSFVQASTKECVNGLFSLTGADARAVFRQTQMMSIAGGFQSASRTYPGNDSTGVLELVLYLRAGLFVQFYHPSDVGPYDANLTAAVRSGLDTFFAAPRSGDVSAGNGDVLSEAVILTDSADLQGSYLSVYKRLLNGYTSAYDAFASMVAAVNNVYTPLWRGNWNPSFVSAVTADPSITDTLSSFAINHLNLLGGNNDVLASNAGNDLARMVEHAALKARIRPLSKGLLNASSITGRTANLWVHVAYQSNVYDATQCSFYGTCDLPGRLTAAALPTTFVCDNRTILAQALSAADLNATCASLRGQDPFFHNLVRDSGPIPGQFLSTIRLAVFASKQDYATYSWAIFGNSTDNGGETLIGDPSDPNNQPVSVMYQKPFDTGHAARIWNLNHEYTHYLDARDDMKGDFGAQISVPDIWWIEGLAEYISYSYRGIAYPEAIAEAGRHTYALSTLWQSTYANSDIARIYYWGYLAARYMFERHPGDIANILARFRVADYQGGYSLYSSGIGTRYDADFNTWLDACAAGACSGGGGGLPTCSSPDTRTMDRNCLRPNRSAATGNLDYLYILLPAGTVTLTVTTSGGTGNADLYYNPSTWATPSAYTARSINSGNTERITVTNTTAGYRYLSLYAAASFSGVTVSTQY